jgi:hypothetical protein
VGAIRHFARWLAWQIGEHGIAPSQPLAHITVFSSDGVEDF